MPGQLWTIAEKNIILEKYPKHRICNWHNLLPNRSMVAISTQAIRMGLRKNINGMRKYEVNDNFFENITPCTSYWAGFIAADGSVDVDYNNTLSIGLSVKDKDHLDKLRLDLVPDKPLCYSKDRTRVTLNVKSNKILDDLRCIYNITERKSRTLKPPNLSDLSLALAYSAGLYDGDGTTRDNGNTMVFLGTLAILDWIREKYDIVGCTGLHHGVWYWAISSFYATPKILTIRDMNLPLLNRKWTPIFLYLDSMTKPYPRVTDLSSKISIARDMRSRGIKWLDIANTLGGYSSPRSCAASLGPHIR